MTDDEWLNNTFVDVTMTPREWALVAASVLAGGHDEAPRLFHLITAAVDRSANLPDEADDDATGRPHA